MGHTKAELDALFSNFQYQNKDIGDENPYDAFLDTLSEEDANTFNSKPVNLTKPTAPAPTKAQVQQFFNYDTVTQTTVTGKTPSLPGGFGKKPLIPTWGWVVIIGGTALAITGIVIAIVKFSK